MRGAHLCDVLQRQLNVDSDAQLSRKLGITPAYVSQIRNSDEELTTKRVAGLIKRTVAHSIGALFEEAITPIVEFFPIGWCESKQGAKWLPFDYSQHPGLREDLISAKGLYMYYNSEGEIIYVGRSKRNILDEMINAYNRLMRSYTMYKVAHPWGRYKPSTGSQLRQIGRANAKICDTASYFLCYRVVPDLIVPLEALLIRVIPNDVINVRMERAVRRLEAGVKK